MSKNARKSFDVRKFESRTFPIRRTNGRNRFDDRRGKPKNGRNTKDIESVRLLSHESFRVRCHMSPFGFAVTRVLSGSPSHESFRVRCPHESLRVRCHTVPRIRSQFHRWNSPSVTSLTKVRSRNSSRVQQGRPPAQSLGMWTGGGTISITSIGSIDSFGFDPASPGDSSS